MEDMTFRVMPGHQILYASLCLLCHVANSLLLLHSACLLDNQPHHGPSISTMGPASVSPVTINWNFWNQWAKINFPPKSHHLRYLITPRLIRLATTVTWTHVCLWREVVDNKGDQLNYPFFYMSTWHNLESSEKGVSIEEFPSSDCPVGLSIEYWHDC